MQKTKILVLVIAISTIAGFISIASALTIVAPGEAVPARGLAPISLKTVEAIPSNSDDIAVQDLRQSFKIADLSGQGNEVLIKAAKVIEVNSIEAGTVGSIKISIFGYQYTVVIPSGIKILKESWEESKLTEFSVGDIVNIWGFLDASDNYRINTRTVRNISLRQRHTALTGIITSISVGVQEQSNIPAKNSFTLQTKKTRVHTVVVAVGPNTKIVKGQRPVVFSDLTVGMDVLVRGIWKQNTAEIDALVVQIITDMTRKPPEPSCVVVYNQKSDINRNGNVDENDLVLFGQAFGATSTTSPNYNVNADYDNDGDVNGTDLSVFSEAYKKANKKIKYDEKADIDRDSDVNGTDLVSFMNAFGAASSTDEKYKANADYDSDGDIDGSDLAVFSKAFKSSFGAVCVSPAVRAQDTIDTSDTSGGSGTTSGGGVSPLNTSGRGKTDRANQSKDIQAQIAELLEKVKAIQLQIQNRQ